MSLSKLHNDIQPLEYSTEQQMRILCDMCGKLFQHKSTYNRHIEHSHRDLSKFECKHCGKSFSRLDNIRRHVKNIHNDFLGQPFKRTSPTLTVSPPPSKIKKPQSTPYYSEPQTSQSYVYQQTLRKSQKPMKWLLNTTNIPTRKVLQHSYPRIKDSELTKQPRTIRLEPVPTPRDHYSTVYPPPVIEDPRIFSSPTRPNTQHQDETIKMIDELLQAILENNKEATPPTTPTPSPTFDDLPTYMDEWLTLDSIGRCDTVEEICEQYEDCIL